MRASIFLVIGTVLALGAADLHAASICQKGGKVRLRPSGCKGKETSIPFGNVDLTGTWKHRQGAGLADGPFASTFLILNADASGRLLEQDPTSQARQCRPFRWSGGGGTPSFVMQVVSSHPTVVQAARSGDVLSITDESGTSTYDRVAAVDAGADCGTLTAMGTLTGLPRPGSPGGLAFDGTSFFYRTNGMVEVVQITAATGAEAPPPSTGNVRQPLAVEGGDLWGTCFCGGGEDVYRVTPTSGTQVDTFTTTDLGHDGGVEALAVPSAGQLLVLVRESATNKNQLLLVNTAGEPDTVASATPIALDLNGLAFDGTTLWGLLGSGSASSVVRIDPTTGKATATFTIPTPGIGWQGMATAPGKIFLVGQAPDDTGVIATFAAPTS